MEESSGGERPLEAHLVACVQESLALYMHDNASFLAERLVAEFPSEVRRRRWRWRRRLAGGCCGFRRRNQRRVQFEFPIRPCLPTGQRVPAGHLLLSRQPALSDVPPAQGWAPALQRRTALAWLRSGQRCEARLQRRQLERRGSRRDWTALTPCAVCACRCLQACLARRAATSSRSAACSWGS